MPAKRGDSADRGKSPAAAASAKPSLSPPRGPSPKSATADGSSALTSTTATKKSPTTAPNPGSKDRKETPPTPPAVKATPPKKETGASSSALKVAAAARSETPPNPDRTKGKIEGGNKTPGSPAQVLTEERKASAGRKTTPQKAPAAALLASSTAVASSSVSPAVSDGKPPLAAVAAAATSPQRTSPKKVPSPAGPGQAKRPPPKGKKSPSALPTTETAASPEVASEAHDSAPETASKAPDSAVAAPVAALLPAEARLLAVTRKLTAIYEQAAPEKISMAAMIAKEFSGSKESILFTQLENKYPSVVPKGHMQAEVSRLEKEILAANAASRAVAAAATSRALSAPGLSAPPTASTPASSPQTIAESPRSTVASADASLPVPMETYPGVPLAPPGASATGAQQEAHAVMLEAVSSFYAQRCPAQQHNAAALLARHAGFEAQLFTAMEKLHAAPAGEIANLVAAGLHSRPRASQRKPLLAVADAEDVWETAMKVSAPQGTASSRRRSADYTLREQLCFLCDRFCPSKSSLVDRALVAFGGKEAELLVRLHDKYGITSSDEYLPSVDDEPQSEMSAAAEAAGTAAAENLPPSLKQAADFARFYGLGPQFVPKIVLEVGSSDPDTVMFELICAVFPDAVEGALADQAQLLSHTSRRVCEFLSYHNPSKLSAVPKYMRHYHTKGLDTALSDLLLWSYGDLLRRVKLRSMKAADLVPADEALPTLPPSAKLEAAVRHAEFRRACERWGQHYGSTAARFSRSTPREPGRIGEMADAATTTAGLLAMASKEVLTNHHEAEALRLLGLREVACETDVKHDTGVSYRSIKDREERGLGIYEPSEAERRRERHVELYGALPPKPLIERDPASGDVFITNPAIFIDDPACARCMVLETQLVEAQRRLQELRLDAQVRERLRLFDELGAAATEEQMRQQPPNPYNTASHPLPRYLPPSFYNTPSIGDSRRSPHRQTKNSGGLLHGCEGCQELRGQLNFLSQKLHHLRVAKAEGERSGMLAAVTTPSPPAGASPSVTGSVWDTLKERRNTPVLSPGAVRSMGTMRDEGTMSSLTFSDISRLEDRSILDKL
jgi:hypothetical protein